LSEFKPSGFSKKDYRKLHAISKVSWLRWDLARADFRDKIVQREIRSEKILNILFCSFEDLPLYMSDEDDAVKEIVSWRIKLNK
jgi:hypothetical protein